MNTLPSGGPSRARLDAEELLAASEQATGLRDYGETDPRDSLRRLVRSLNEEAALTEAGVTAKRASLIRVLSNRLLLQDQFNRNPRIAEQRISRPIVILGLPRSGTTKLHRMIAADPQMQKLPLWKLLYPVRALAPGPGSDVQNRIAAAAAFVASIRDNNPAMYAGHPMLAEEPDEEYFAMEISFLAHINTSSFYTPSYESWLDAQPFDNWYAWLVKFMQYQQHVDGGAGRPWVLKAPHHLGYLPLLYRHFPDATVVHCHRDPVTTMRSFAALIGSSRAATSYNYSPREVGRYILRVYGRRIALYLRDRSKYEGSHPFVDLDYRRILREAPTVIAECYAAAGIPLTETGLAAMRAWESTNQQHKHGQHRYDVADFGLEDAEIGELFEAYTARFSKFLG